MKIILAKMGSAGASPAVSGAPAGNFAETVVSFGEAPNDAGEGARAPR
jgi:hypothetical protein